MGLAVIVAAVPMLLVGPPTNVALPFVKVIVRAAKSLS